MNNNIIAIVELIEKYKWLIFETKDGERDKFNEVSFTGDNGWVLKESFYQETLRQVKLSEVVNIYSADSIQLVFSTRENEINQETTVNLLHYKK